jgi:hypothetical protein
MGKLVEYSNTQNRLDGLQEDQKQCERAALVALSAYAAAKDTGTEQAPIDWAATLVCDILLLIHSRGQGLFAPLRAVFNGVEMFNFTRAEIEAAKAEAEKATRPPVMTGEFLFTLANPPAGLHKNNELITWHKELIRELNDGVRGKADGEKAVDAPEAQAP